MLENEKDVVTTFILRISCVLSILGSLIVMTACRFPETMRKKKGRTLIFWLSVSDFGTSVVYFLSTFENSEQNTPTCKTLALLGIFFPVASFFWTDFIAWHIYITIAERKIKTDQDWNRIMMIFHILAWGCSGLCISIIAIFDHAGRGEDNTGGWCWVEASDKSLIYWELIGGKFVEWSSCFIWLPYMYFLTIRTLYVLEQSGAVALPRAFTRGSINSTPSASVDQGNIFGNRKFQIFYLKMALVPIIFFLTRIWGTLRIFLSLANNSTADHVASSLFYMQAIFDPSQGFFNAIIFVFLSSKDRANLGIFLTTPYLFLQFISWLRSLCGYSDVTNDSSGELQYPGRDNRDRLVGGTVTSPLARPSRFAVQEDTIVELSSHFHTESEMTNYFDRSESEESSRVPTISRITRDSFSVPTFNDEC